ncbi:MAG: hypothetical protein HZA89_18475 [Verrucomicrobia bacterium]|nr:hypothetical protein [Verrucomicrobiota bacterium]
MKIFIRDGDIHLINLRTRMPFKYGIATMTRMPMAFVRLRVEVDGRSSPGVAADLLPPKWFTKVPERAVEPEIREMLRCIQHALKTALEMNGASAFDLWRELYETQALWAEAEKLPPLLAHFGTSLVERALIEAVCRAAGRPFHRLLRANHFGIRLGEIHPALEKLQPADLLPEKPLNEITLRHTVGLLDPLTDADIPPGEKLDDGLPQSLAECIRRHGLRHFKIKVNGQPENDQARLRSIADVIQANAPADFAFSLDGNEQFKSLESFRAFWETISADEKMRPFLQHLLFVEQPLHRAEALKPAVGEAFKAWPGRPPMIIDESDATLESLPAALRLGYNGTSHKNCKGVFKGIANRCLLLHRQREEPARRFLMSGEDLCNVGPVSLPQDLAVCAALGVESVERNGHHYNAGLSQFPATVQEQVLKLHPDLYHRSAAGWPTLAIESGKIQLGSVNESPFGVRFVVDVSQFTADTEWKAEK